MEENEKAFLIACIEVKLEKEQEVIKNMKKSKSNKRRR